MDEKYYYTANAEQRYDDASRRGRMGGWESPRPQQRPAPMQQSYASAPSQGGVVIYTPSTYEDVQLLIDHLRMREQVIVDFSSVNKASVYRILDFMSGAIYALGGSIQPLTTNIFLFAPAGVTITIPPQFGRK